MEKKEMISAIKALIQKGLTIGDCYEAFTEAETEAAVGPHAILQTVLKYARLHMANAPQTVALHGGKYRHYAEWLSELLANTSKEEMDALYSMSKGKDQKIVLEVEDASFNVQTLEFWPAIAIEDLRHLAMQEGCPRKVTSLCDAMLTYERFKLNAMLYERHSAMVTASA